MFIDLPMYWQPMVWICHRPLDQDMHQFRVIRAGHVPAYEEDGNPIQPRHRIITVTELLHKGNNCRAGRSCRCTAAIVQVHGSALLLIISSHNLVVWHQVHQRCPWSTHCATLKLTRKLCYRKDDRAVRPIHGALKIFGTPWLRPRLLFPTFFMGFCSDPPYECSFKIWNP